MRNHSIRVFAAAALAFVAVACNNDINSSASPVDLVATNTQVINRIDIFDTTNCNRAIGTISMQAIEKNPNSGSTNTTFNQVRVTRYQVSYVRTDGGKQVPASFVRSIDTLLIPGGSAQGLSSFIVLEPEALLQAPFVALIPINGGRDPDTGQTVVKMDVVVTLFGATLAGTNVSATTRFPLDFCYNCGGCS
jgi:hypothetical protein